MGNEQNIREVCARLLLSHEGEEFRAALTELKLAIYQQVTDADNHRMAMIAEMPKNGTGD